MVKVNKAVGEHRKKHEEYIGGHYKVGEFVERSIVDIFPNWAKASWKADLEASKGRFFKVPTKEGYISAVMIANTPVLNEYGKYSNWNYIETTDSFCIIEFKTPIGDVMKKFGGN